MQTVVIRKCPVLQTYGKTGLFIPRVKIKWQIESWPPTHTSIDLTSEDGGAIAICLLLNVVNSTTLLQLNSCSLITTLEFPFFFPVQAVRT